MLKNSDTYLNIAMSILRDVDCSNKHASFIVHKNRIISVGVNSNKSHPLARSKGYPLEGIHAELSALIGASSNFNLAKCKLVNVRLSGISWRKNEPVLRMSKPCKYCHPWVTNIFKEVYYTTDDGWERLIYS